MTEERDLSDVIDILATLVGFATLTNGPNLDLINWVEDVLTDASFAVTRIPSPCGTKAGLLAKFGQGDGGVLYSAHSDVVPIAGQDWTSDAFKLRREGDRLIGRGTTDMKGFLACVLAQAKTLHDSPPAKPVMIALSWDEEIGCRGIPHMIDHVIPTLGRPDLVIVGEPTEMQLCLGHKGKASYRATCHGETGHSALAPNFRNALHVAADVVAALRDTQAALAQHGARDPNYDIAYSTIHAGKMSGGTALNIVPERAVIDFEVRHIAAESASAIIAQLRQRLPQHVTLEQTNAYPGFEAAMPNLFKRDISGIYKQAPPIKVGFGTEAGFFAGLGLQTVVCGPGSMKQDGHQPNEGVTIAQLRSCSEALSFISGL